ncbi:hypothetical protein ACLFLT_25965 [Klebsiella pneumoniae]
MRGAVPILLAGNSYLLKHAPNADGQRPSAGRDFCRRRPAGWCIWLGERHQ